MGIKHFRSIYSRDRLPNQIRKKECGIINLDSIEGEGTHWVCYRNIDENMVEYFDPFVLIMPHEIHHYLLTPGKKVIFSQDEIQNRNTVLCGYWCSYYLIERQKRKVFWMLFITKTLMKTTMISLKTISLIINS